MKVFSSFLVVCCFSLLAVGAGCRKESRAKETASVQQDTMLMRDLAEANRNTATASALDNSLNTVNTTGAGGTGASPSDLVASSQTRPTDRAAAPAGGKVLTSGPRLPPPTQASHAPGR